LNLLNHACELLADIGVLSQCSVTVMSPLVDAAVRG
jgi:hypothetical protein